MQESAFVRMHPFLPEAVWPTTVPIGMHGDGGAFNKHDSLYTIAWNSLVAKGATVQTRFLFTVAKKTDMTDATLDALMDMFGWSCNVLLSGQTPHTDWHHPPRPLDGGGCDLTPDGLRGCLTQARGDWERMVKLFHFPRWDQSRMCPYCAASANDPAFIWTDFAARDWFCDFGNQLGAMYSRLAIMWFDRGLRLWKLSPKLHQWMHLTLHQILMGKPATIGAMGMRI